MFRVMQKMVEAFASATHGERSMLGDVSRVVAEGVAQDVFHRFLDADKESAICYSLALLADFSLYQISLKFSGGQIAEREAIRHCSTTLPPMKFRTFLQLSRSYAEALSMKVPPVPGTLKNITVDDGSVVDDEDIAGVKPVLDENIYFVGWCQKIARGPGTARPKRRLNAVLPEPAQVRSRYDPIAASITSFCLKVEDAFARGCRQRTNPPHRRLFSAPVSLLTIVSTLLSC